MVQDTTSLNFTGLHMIPEPGPIDSGGLAAVGVHLHTTLALTVSGQVIGILDQRCLGTTPTWSAWSPGNRERQVDQRQSR